MQLLFSYSRKLKKRKKRQSVHYDYVIEPVCCQNQLIRCRMRWNIVCTDCTYVVAIWV